MWILLIFPPDDESSSGAIAPTNQEKDEAAYIIQLLYLGRRSVSIHRGGENLEKIALNVKIVDFTRMPTTIHNILKTIKRTEPWIQIINTRSPTGKSAATGWLDKF